MQINLNTLGFITGMTDVSCIDSDNPVYLVVFKDHCKTDPTCKELDTSAPIEVDILSITEKQSFVSFRKIVDNLVFQFDFMCMMDFIKIELSIISEYIPGYRFGLVFPVGSNCSLKCFEKKIETSVSNFFNVFENVFRDQQNLETPMILVEDEKNVRFFSGKETTNYQFFHYKSKHHDNIRITCNTSCNNKMELIFKPNMISGDEKILYKIMNPESSIFNKYRKPIENIEQKYNITTKVFRGEKKQYQIKEKVFSVEEPDDKNLLSFCVLLNKELEKYLPAFWDTIKLDGIYLCSNLLENQKYGHKFVVGAVTAQIKETETWIFYDILGANAWTIHHELFHLAERAIDCNDFPEGNLNLFRDMGYEYNDSAEYNYEELRADLFGAAVSNSLCVKNINKTDSLLEEQTIFIKNKTKDWISWEKPSAFHLDDRYVYAYHKEGNSFTKIPFLQLDYESDISLTSMSIENAHNWIV